MGDDVWRGRPIWYLECRGCNYAAGWGLVDDNPYGYGPANFLEVMAAYTELVRRFREVLVTHKPIRCSVSTPYWGTRLSWVVLKTVPERYRSAAFTRQAYRYG
jgi:hypothetical protein